MSDEPDRPNQPQPSAAGITPMPDLIERYRLRRDAWIAQADELARLRDDVRGSAEREAMEIVTRARRDVRQVVMEARRELLVLSAQVQAALGEAAVKPDVAALLQKAGVSPSDRQGPSAPSGGAGEFGFAPDRAVDEILSEVHADIEALADDVRTLPLQTEPQPAAGGPPPEAPPRPKPSTVSNQPPTDTAPARDGGTPPVFSLGPSLSEAASKVLLSSPFPSESVSVHPGRSVRTFVSFLAVIGLVVALITVWWVRRPDIPEAPVEIAETAPETEVTEAPVPTPPGEAAESGAPVVPPAPRPALARASRGTRNLSVFGQALREVWVRTTVDGQSDLGRTLVAGQSLEVLADESVALRVGDAGALLVSVNDGEARPVGDDGQVVTRQYLAEGAPPPSRPPQADAATPQPSASASLASAAPPSPSVVPAAPSQAPPVPVPSLTSAPAPTSRVGSPGNTAPVSAPPPTAVETTPPQTISPATAVVAAARQWLDAYHRQDRASMAALATENMLLTDERRNDERLPPGLPNVTRSLDRVSVQIAADTAVLTAVMTEQSDSVPGVRVSPVSQVWVLAEGGAWKVRQVRFVSEARLNQVFQR